MTRFRYRALLLAALTLAALAALAGPRRAHAQTFGLEAHNTLMPASGAMGGASIARPQDLTSAINGNPATLTQFQGTQFLFGGAWAEPTFNLDQRVTIPAMPPPGPFVEPYFAKSTAPGSPMGNIGVTQDLSELGLPATFGLGFVTTSGGAFDFRQIPESGGTNTSQAIFSLPAAVGIDVSDRLSIGASLAMGIAFFDGPLVGVGGMTSDYALRGTLGANYNLGDCTQLGFYYQTEQAFRFDHAFQVSLNTIDISRDVNMDLPQNLGLGWAHSGFLDGRLLLAVDVLFKMWNEAQLYGALYDNQWVVQIGAQYTAGRYRFRAGYAWAEDPIDPTPGTTIGGVIEPGGLPAVRYSQALVAVTSEHRFTTGVGVVDVLPGVDLDLLAGVMLSDTEQLGPDTTTRIESYWVGAGMTWRFGRGACCHRLPPPDRWSE